MKEDFSRSLLVFTDGASSGNPGPGGWGAILVFPFLDEVVELGGSKPRTTNNEMELSALVGALSYAVNNTSEAHIFSDSKYVIEGVSRWIHTWEKTNWRTASGGEVANRTLWETLAQLVHSREEKATITYHHLPGHSGVPGNERADEIATALGSGKMISLYRGKLSSYTIPILDFTVDQAKSEKRGEQKKRSHGKAYSYLSLVDDVLMRHETWRECEARVRGVANTKYKKTLSPKDERDILKSWGFNPEMFQAK